MRGSWDEQLSQDESGYVSNDDLEVPWAALRKMSPLVVAVGIPVVKNSGTIVSYAALTMIGARMISATGNAWFSDSATNRYSSSDVCLRLTGTGVQAEYSHEQLIALTHRIFSLRALNPIYNLKDNRVLGGMHAVSGSYVGYSTNANTFQQSLLLELIYPIYSTAMAAAPAPFEEV